MTVEKIDDSHANLVFTGKLAEGYHIFSLKHDPSMANGTGLVPQFDFKKSPNYKLIGKPFEIGKPIKHVDDDSLHDPSELLNLPEPEVVS
jgi:hypothetical protein